MTVIAAFQCNDGLLMCADSEQSIFGSDTKSQVRKIEAFKAGHASVAIGGAGDASMVEYVQYQFHKKMAIESLRWENIDHWLESFAKDMWNTCVRPYRGFTSNVPTADFLVGIQMFDSYALYGLDGNMVREIQAIRPHVSIGIGSIQAESLLSDLQDFHIEAAQMLFYAVRVMLRVKQLVQGCGGKTEVVLLRNNGLDVSLATATIDAIEHLIEEVDYFLAGHPLRFIAGLSDIDPTDDLKRQVNRIKDFQATYKSILPRVFYR